LKFDQEISKKNATVNEQRNPFHKCPLEICKALPSYKKLCPDPDLITGVITIQSSDWNSLTNDEANSCKHLLVQNVEKCLEGPLTTAAARDSIDGDSPASPIGMSSHIKKTKENKKPSCSALVKSTSPYVNCDFIYGSAAKVEWLWSLAKMILSSQRASLTPLMFESLLFLRVNERFWDLNTIIEALAMAKASAKGDRLKQKIADESVMESFVEDLTTDDISDDLDDSDVSDEEETTD
jgi:hypothetical protein